MPIIQLLLTYKYIILFPLAIIEGPFTMMISGLLVKLGYLNFFFVFLLLMSGDLVGDVMWYSIGRIFGISFVKKFGKFFGITEQVVKKVENIFHKHHSPIIFLSKITMGLGFALVTLITAGLVKIPVKRFILWNTLGGLVWTSGLMMIGFYLGNFYLKIDNFLGKLSILASLVIIFIILISIARYVRNKFQ